MTFAARIGLVGIAILLGGCGSPPPEPPQLPAALYGEVAAAVRQAREAVVRSPRSAEVWGELAMLLDAHDQTAEAVDCYGQAMQLDETDPRWPYLLANLLAGSDPAQAEQLFRAAVKNSSQPEPGLRLAAMLRDRGAPGEAVEVLRIEAAADPEVARIHYELARCLDQAGRLDEAIEAAMRAARLAPQHRSVRELAAELLARDGRLEEARQEADLARRLPSETAGWPDPWREAVRSLRRDPHWQASSIAMAATAGRMPAGEALSTLAALASEHPDDWTIAGEFAQLLLMAGEHQAAIEAASTALDLHPDAVGLWKIRGAAELLTENWASAEADLLQAVALKPDDAAAWNDLAFVQEQLGRDAAVASLETAIRLEPLDIDKRVRLVELLTDRRLFAEASRELDTIASMAGELPVVAELRKAVAAAASPEPLLPADTSP
jgi:Flp pilus assembly protein TadD